MCGIIGAAGNLWSFDRKAVRQLLILDTIRGEDSTGLVYVPKLDNKDGVAKHVKQLGHPVDLMSTSPGVFDEKTWELKVEGKVFIGHNRSATIGDVNVENAHPFKFGPITGVHNGTLNTYFLDELDDHKDFAVDSQVIYHNIAKNGWEATIPKIYGAYALVWYDDRDQHVYFIRNDQRPLWCVRTKDKDGFYWASEKWMLEVALSKSNILFEEPKFFEKDWLYRIDVSNGDVKFRDVKLEKVKEIKGYSPKNYYSPYTGGYTGYGHGGTSNQNVFNKNNVTNFPKINKETLKAQKKKLDKLVRTEIDFFMDQKRWGKNHMSYLECSPADLTTSYEIRIYTADANNGIFKEILDGGSSVKWSGTVKQVVIYNDVLYVRLDNRTIKKVVDYSDSTEELKGYEGRFLTEDEWYKCTDDGCSYCTASVSLLEHTKIKWLNHDSFLCPECSGNPQAVSFMNEYNAIKH